MITLRAVINSGLPLMTLSRTSTVNISQAHSPFSGWMLKAHILPLKDDVRNYSKRLPGRLEHLPGYREPSDFSWQLVSVSVAVECPSPGMTQELHWDRIWISLFEQVPFGSYVIPLPWELFHKVQWYRLDRTINDLLSAPHSKSKGI